MKIYTVITQTIDREGHHLNSINNFTDFEKAKNFIDDCVEGNKRLEGEDTFSTFDITGAWTEFGWIFNDKVLYGVEMRREKEGKLRETHIIKRFILETEV